MVNPLETYRTYSKYYDNYIGSFSKDLEFYKSLINKNDSIIELGCGTGRVLKYFIEMDYTITGVDISNEMLEICKAKLFHFISANKLYVYNHDFSSAPFNELFDIAIVTFYTFNYVSSPLIFLQNVFTSLNDGALIIIDLYYPHVFLNLEIENKWIISEIKGNKKTIILKDKRCFENHIEHRIQIFSINGIEELINSSRVYYNPYEIKSLLKKVGFKNIQYTLNYRYDSFLDEIEEVDIKSENYIIKAEK